MIDKFYYYFLKTKYCDDYTQKEIRELESLFKRIKKSGIPITALSNLKRSAIELGVLKRELSNEHRHVDNFILTTPSIVEAFIENELSFETGLKRLGGELYKT